MNAHHKKSVLFVITALLLCADFYMWQEIFVAHSNVARDYFLNVGQGDSELIIFPGNITVMTDAGPDGSVLASLARVMPTGDDYIDLAIISHPQLDHFNGYNVILDHYHIGAFIYNGRDDDPGVKQWPALKAKIKAKGIPLITLGGGDTIMIGGTDNNGSAADEIDMLSPNTAFAQSAELNDTGLVELIKTPEFRTLLTADIGFNVEDWLVVNHVDIQADVLKVPHHGSPYSSGDAFLRTVNPKVAAIEVGAHNTYGHPGSSTLARLASDTQALIFRTDNNGTIEVYPNKGTLTVLKNL